jgi:hypothetical protein
MTKVPPRPGGNHDTRARLQLSSIAPSLPVLFPIWLLYHAIPRKSASFVSLPFRGTAPERRASLPYARRIDQDTAREERVALRHGIALRRRASDGTAELFAAEF